MQTLIKILKSFGFLLLFEVILLVLGGVLQINNMVWFFLIGTTTIFFSIFTPSGKLKDLTAVGLISTLLTFAITGFIVAKTVKDNAPLLFSTPKVITENSSTEEIKDATTMYIIGSVFDPDVYGRYNGANFRGSEFKYYATPIRFKEDDQVKIWGICKVTSNYSECYWSSTDTVIATFNRYTSTSNEEFSHCIESAEKYYGFRSIEDPAFVYIIDRSPSEFAWKELKWAFNIFFWLNITWFLLSIGLAIYNSSRKKKTSHHL